MALSKFPQYGRLIKDLAGLKRHSSRHYGTATASALKHGTQEERTRSFRLYTKSHISALFETYAPSLDPQSYLAAAQVFPMRANNYVVEDLIDWLVSGSFPLMTTLRAYMAHQFEERSSS